MSLGGQVVSSVRKLKKPQLNKTTLTVLRNKVNRNKSPSLNGEFTGNMALLKGANLPLTDLPAQKLCILKHRLAQVGRDPTSACVCTDRISLEFGCEEGSPYTREICGFVPWCTYEPPVTSYLSYVTAE